MFSAEVKGIHLDYETCMDVYPPSDDTFLMMESISPKGKCLEIGSGTGLTSVYMAKLGHEVVACDINRKAVDCTLRNAKINNVEIEAKWSNLFSEIKGEFDTIVFNPPYLPTEDHVQGSEQWDGGLDGFDTSWKFLSEADCHLNPDGKIFLILSSLTDLESFIRKWPVYDFRIMGKNEFFFEKIYCFEIKKNRYRILIGNHDIC